MNLGDGACVNVGGGEECVISKMKHGLKMRKQKRKELLSHEPAMGGKRTAMRARKMSAVDMTWTDGKELCELVDLSDKGECSICFSRSYIASCLWSYGVFLKSTRRWIGT